MKEKGKTSKKRTVKQQVMNEEENIHGAIFK
jgi:hypothetical protein